MQVLLHLDNFSRFNNVSIKNRKITNFGIKNRIENSSVYISSRSFIRTELTVGQFICVSQVDVGRCYLTFHSFHISCLYSAQTRFIVRSISTVMHTLTYTYIQNMYCNINARLQYTHRCIHVHTHEHISNDSVDNKYSRDQARSYILIQFYMSGIRKTECRFCIIVSNNKDVILRKDRFKLFYVQIFAQIFIHKYKRVHLNLLKIKSKIFDKHSTTLSR